METFVRNSVAYVDDTFPWYVGIKMSPFLFDAVKLVNIFKTETIVRIKIALKWLFHSVIIDIKNIFKITLLQKKFPFSIQQVDKCVNK